jgi:ABC-type sugar transport system ATPase subunit
VEAHPARERVVAGLRPEAVVLSPLPTSHEAGTAFEAHVYAVEPLGDENIVDVRVPVPAGNPVPLLVRTPPAVRPRVGNVVWITPKSAEVHLFDADSGEALRAAATAGQ